MSQQITLTQNELIDFLLNVAPIRPVFIWGQPGIGKSALVEEFADSVCLPCISLLGSQLAPEDLIGVPKIEGNISSFCPPKMIARDEPYCLFLDELNACTSDVQKAFYSLIHERRIGEYHLPPGSVVIGAGNRAQDSAIVRPMSSALMNRMIHVHLQANTKDWLQWAETHSIHPYITDYIRNRPDHLFSAPPKHEEPFSTPRSWHMLSDALSEYGENPSDNIVEILSCGCLTPAHAVQFRAFLKVIRGKFQINAIIKGETRFPDRPEERDMLYFLTQSFRGKLVKELPHLQEKHTSATRQLAIRAKEMIVELSRISLEMAQLVVIGEDTADQLPPWFVMEIARDLPRIAKRDSK